jgi:hypothetical protein
LKELGFDEPCFRWYDERWGDDLQQDKINTNKDLFMTDLDCSAPLYQQAFRWFREKYGLMGSVCEDVDGNFSLWTNKGNLLLQGKEYKEYKTYEEAELACLRKLIEIVRNATKE